MWFTISSVKLCIPATVFYSTILSSKCEADDIPVSLWRNDDESIHIYKTEIPWTPIQLDTEKNNFAIVAWTAVLSVAVSVAAIVCLCFLCWKLYPRYGSRRQSSNAALVPTLSSTVVDFQTDQEVDRQTRNSRGGNIYSTEVMNFSFTGNIRDPTSTPQHEDGPPAYSTVISQTLFNDKLTSTPYPSVSDSKTVETPPPAYITVAPFR